MVHRRALAFDQHPQFKSVLRIYHSLVEKGHSLVLAGGAVRDALRGEMPKDIDLVTSATPDEIAEIFPRTVPVGKSFGVMIVIEGGHSFEVATFRKEHAYHDGRRPSGVEWGTPEEDAERRDFTVNGLFYEPVKKEIWDYVGGLKDLEQKTLRAIGKAADRFQEDHLRVLRAYRFRAQLGFAWEAQLAIAVAQSSKLLPSVSRERVREELLRLFASPYRSEVLKPLLENQVLETLFAGTAWSEKSYREWCDHKEDAGLLELSYWHWHENQSRDKLDRFLEDLKLSRRQMIRARRALTLFVESEVWLNNERSPLGKIVANLFDEDFRRGAEQFRRDLDSTALSKKLNLAWSLYDKWQGEKPAAFITSADLKFLAGPPLGEALRRAEWMQLEGQTRNEVLQWIKENSSSREP